MTMRPTILTAAALALALGGCTAPQFPNKSGEILGMEWPVYKSPEPRVARDLPVTYTEKRDRPARPSKPLPEPKPEPKPCSLHDHSERGDNGGRAHDHEPGTRRTPHTC